MSGQMQMYGPGEAYGPGQSHGQGDPFAQHGPYGPRETFERGGGFDGPRRRKSRAPLVFGIAGVVGVLLLGGGVGLAMALSGSAESEPSAPTAGPSQDTPTASPSPTASEGAMAKTRATDPRPLTLGEVFKRKSFKEGGKRYTMTIRRHDRNCTKGVHGARLESTLRKAGCSQILRASFADSDGKLIGTVGVANVRTQTTAKIAQRATNSDESYVQPLPGRGHTRKLGQGSALGSSDVRGHYLILSWTQYPDGTRIPKSQWDTIATFEKNVILGSKLGEALEYRAMTGKPYGT